MTATRTCDLVCFDLDGTLIQGTIFIWQTLHDHLGTDPARRARAKADFGAGRISYREWFEHDLQLFAEVGARRADLLAALDGVRPTPGARETLAALRAAGCQLAILSGSLDLVLERYFPDEAFAGVLINRLTFSSTGEISGGEATAYDIDRKGDGVRELARRAGATLARTAFVGDNYNDVSAAQTAGLAIAFNPRSAELEAAAAVIIREPDLRAILPHLLG